MFLPFSFFWSELSSYYSFPIFVLLFAAFPFNVLSDSSMEDFAKSPELVLSICASPITHEHSLFSMSASKALCGPLQCPHYNDP